MSGYELLSQYTEDAFAQDDRLCERPACGAKICRGDPCFYVGTMDPRRPGRYVCGSCHERYRGKLATSVRPTTNSELFTAHSSLALMFGVLQGI
jgi:hypothetical protein